MGHTAWSNELQCSLSCFFLASGSEGDVGAARLSAMSGNTEGVRQMHIHGDYEHARGRISSWPGDGKDITNPLIDHSVSAVITKQR